MPGNRFAVENDPNGLSIHGKSIGHGLGLCQLGAIGMASAGADFRSILAHFYPNSELLRLAHVALEGATPAEPVHR